MCIHELKAEEHGLATDVKIWTDKVDSKAKAQLLNAARMPFVAKMAVMPDVHWGMGATVGSVIATRNAVMPAAVGVDVGCGMLALPLGIKEGHLDNRLSDIRSEIERAVPVGFGQHKKFRGLDAEKKLLNEKSPTMERIEKLGLAEKAAKQFGTLGGGNHFIEIVYDETGELWIMLHSGSRGTGNKLAMEHIHKAKDLAKLANERLVDPNLASFLKGTDEYREYLRDLDWLQRYAWQNRLTMLRLIMNALNKMVETNPDESRMVHCHHNYAVQEEHDGENLIVTRKGAVRAGLGEYGIIPGSMGARSYIVKGKGNKDSLLSCSHGAGRAMSRGAAKQRFTRKDLEKQTEGVECRKDKGVLDEIPGAYKDIDQVMEHQKDLVDVVHKLKQIICVKG